MKNIKLTKGKFAEVDDSDYSVLNGYKWHALKQLNTFYAVRSSSKVNGKRKLIYMHRFILKTPISKDTDHIDGDGLNNQRKNLRVCSHLENSSNRGKTKSNTSGFKGVSWHVSSKKLVARIQHKGKMIILGYFNIKEDAYEKYCASCEKYHKEFSNVK